ncbi:MAG: hypothetical protein HY562_00280 [Ignavibacteriales bacterium]|nr:hypothetical protein [Ignavibacteriales bacterium]
MTHSQEMQSITFFILASVIFTTSVLYANAGTGFFFPAILHVIVGNLFIGLIEAFFVRRVFRVSASYGIIILANYVSSILGYLFAIVTFSDIQLLSSTVLPLTLILLFIASVAIEWPFFARSLKDGSFGYSRMSFKHTLSAQCVSYALLIPYHIFSFDDGRMSSRDFVENDLSNLAAHAYQYRIRPLSMKGGENSYGGYSIPWHLSL